MEALLCTLSYRIQMLLPTAFADAAVAPIDFPIAPAYAVPKVGMPLSVLKVGVTLGCLQREETKKRS